jgi:cyclophilin family peptidyl-prolyl cis-trans isomerase
MFMRLCSHILLTAAFFLVTSKASAAPKFKTIPDTTLLAGSPLHLALDGSDSSGQSLTYTVTTSDSLVSAKILKGNRSLRIKVTGFGEMVFELFDRRAPRATNRIVQLADEGFYNGVTFHRIINDFVIQGGDPTGTGAGGSSRPNFDDQFHIDLQHNRTGLLSMAKSEDDTNDSQFFITEGAQRHLDFNHTIFGVLVEGEDVRQRISNVAVDASDRPVERVVMESVKRFKDAENAVLMLKAPEGQTGAVDVTVTVRNLDGREFSQTFRVNVVPDTVDSPPFLADIPKLRTKVDTAMTYQLKAIDVEGDASFFLDQDTLSGNGLSVPVLAPEDLTYSVDFETGLLTITPTNGLEGNFGIAVATALTNGAVDYQVVDVTITP